jgi:hypothetical protein
MLREAEHSAGPSTGMILSESTPMDVQALTAVDEYLGDLEYLTSFALNDIHILLGTSEGNALLFSVDGSFIRRYARLVPGKAVAMTAILLKGWWAVGGCSNGHVICWHLLSAVCCRERSIRHAGVRHDALRRNGGISCLEAEDNLSNTTGAIYIGTTNGILLKRTPPRLLRSEDSVIFSDFLSSWASCDGSMWDGLAPSAKIQAPIESLCRGHRVVVFGWKGGVYVYSEQGGQVVCAVRGGNRSGPSSSMPPSGSTSSSACNPAVTVALDPCEPWLYVRVQGRCTCIHLPVDAKQWKRKSKLKVEGDIYQFPGDLSVWGMAPIPGEKSLLLAVTRDDPTLMQEGVEDDLYLMHLPMQSSNSSSRGHSPPLVDENVKDSGRKNTTMVHENKNENVNAKVNANVNRGKEKKESKTCRVSDALRLPRSAGHVVGMRSLPPLPVATPHGYTRTPSFLPLSSDKYEVTSPLLPTMRSATLVSAAASIESISTAAEKDGHHDGSGRGGNNSHSSHSNHNQNNDSNHSYTVQVAPPSIMICLARALFVVGRPSAARRVHTLACKGAWSLALQAASAHKRSEVLQALGHAQALSQWSEEEGAESIATYAEYVLPFAPAPCWRHLAARLATIPLRSHASAHASALPENTHHPSSSSSSSSQLPLTALGWLEPFFPLNQPRILPPALYTQILLACLGISIPIPIATSHSHIPASHSSNSRDYDGLERRIRQWPICYDTRQVAVSIAWVLQGEVGENQEKGESSPQLQPLIRALSALCDHMSDPSAAVTLLLHASCPKAAFTIFRKQLHQLVPLWWPSTSNGNHNHNHNGSGSGHSGSHYSGHSGGHGGRRVGGGNTSPHPHTPLPSPLPLSQHHPSTLHLHPAPPTPGSDTDSDAANANANRHGVDEDEEGDEDGVGVGVGEMVALNLSPLPLQLPRPMSPFVPPLSPPPLTDPSPSPNSTPTPTPTPSRSLGRGRGRGMKMKEVFQPMPLATVLVQLMGAAGSARCRAVCQALASPAVVEQCPQLSSKILGTWSAPEHHGCYQPWVECYQTALQASSSPSPSSSSSSKPIDEEQCK